MLSQKKKKRKKRKKNITFLKKKNNNNIKKYINIPKFIYIFHFTIPTQSFPS